jgi:Flp pilus assembly protein TadD
LPADRVEELAKMPTRSTTRLIACVVMLVSALAAVRASATQEASAPPAAPTGAEEPARAATAAEERQRVALARLAAGDVAGTIEGLATVRAQGLASPPELALLGALYLEAGRAAEAREVLAPLAEADPADPAVLYNAGRAALAEGDVAAGRRLLERSVAAVPLSPAGRELGLLLARQGDVVGAYRLLRPWSLRNPDDVEARVTAASLALQLERPGEAEELVAALPADDPAARLLRGRARVARGDAAGALEQLVPLRAAHPPGLELEVTAALAEAHLLAGDAAGARGVLADKTVAHPRLAVLLARAQRAGGDLAGARATLAPFVERLPAEAAAVGDPRIPAAVAAEQGLTLLAGGDRTGGIELLRRATRLYPADAAVWTAMADALAADGRQGEAASARAQAATLEAARQRHDAAAGNGELGAEAMQARRLLSEGRLADALALLEKAASASPQDVGVRMLHAQALLQAGRGAEALAAAEVAVQLRPGEPNVLYLRGAVLIGMRRFDEAEAQLREVILRQPEHAAALNDLAMVVFARGDVDGARALLQRALAASPGDPRVTASLEQLERAARPSGG